MRPSSSLSVRLLAQHVPRGGSSGSACTRCASLHTSVLRKAAATPDAATDATSSSSFSSSEVAVPSSLPAYPFSSKAITRPTPPIPAASLPHLPRNPRSPRRSLLPLVENELKEQWDPSLRLTRLFQRSSPTRIPPGSVVTVETWTSSSSASGSTASRTSFSSFSGVLIAIKRRGTSTSFLVRNILHKLGVEVRFQLYSPLLKDIHVVQRAVAGKNDRQGNLRRARRAKLYYLRRDDRKITTMMGVMKRQARQAQQDQLQQQQQLKEKNQQLQRQNKAKPKQRK